MIWLSQERDFPVGIDSIHVTENSTYAPPGDEASNDKVPAYRFWRRILAGHSEEHATDWGDRQRSAYLQGGVN